MNNSGASTKKMAFSAVMAALGTVLLLLSGVIPIATVAMPAIAGCLAIPVVVEAGRRWAVIIYTACSILSLFLASDKQAVLMFVLFFGYYPIIYANMGRISSKVLKMVAKLAVFNAAVVFEGLISVYLLKIPFEFLDGLGKLTIPVLLVLANAVFILYDYALDGLIVKYLRHVHSKLRNIFRF